VRVCNGCDRPVFNLSAMTREDAAAVLATRGLTPCVRFYRRPDGTVMTTDCPTRPHPERRRLAVVASSLAAGAAIAVASPAQAEPATSSDPQVATAPSSSQIADEIHTMGVPIPFEPEQRPVIEWSTWARLGIGLASRAPDVAAARSSEVVSGPVLAPKADLSSTWEAAGGVDLTLPISRSGDARVGSWGEVRTSSNPVVGAELVVEGLWSHPYERRDDWSGDLVLRAGANTRVVTAAVAVGVVGSLPRHDPWVHWARHVVGGRVVVSMNRSLDDPRDWSATINLEVEPIGVIQAVLDLAAGR
jgi:hypothetical protein